jgi:hypothetical protein
VNTVPVKTAARQAVLWLLLAIVTALLTTLFSILGTLSVAVLTGVAVGASRRWQWQLIPLSLVFPLIGLTLAQAAKADLIATQRLSTVAICFGSFWVTYWLTRGLLSLETPQAGPSPSNIPCPRNDNPVEQKTPQPVNVTDLEGTWVRLPADQNESSSQTIKIKGSTFEVRMVGDNGNSHVLASGEIRLDKQPPVLSVEFNSGKVTAPAILPAGNM